MNQPFIGPIPASLEPSAHLPVQPYFSAWCVGWGAYDVPRIFDIIQPSQDDISWGQAAGFRELSTLLLDQKTAIMTQRDHIGAAWQGPAAALLLSRIDHYAEALLSDAHCAASTANALDSIMNTYAQARERIRVLHDCWNDTTSKWQPFCWDGSAADLNDEAQKLMYSVDNAVRDHRSRITIPDEYTGYIDGSWVRPQPPEGNPPAPTAHEPAAAPTPAEYRRVVPPVPGYHPVDEYPSRQTSERGDGLAGMPSYIPAIPGQPVSMMPIPPGSSYAPHGGAYILPGPGVGPKGYVVPMPQHGNGMPLGRPLPIVPTTSTASSSGFLPMPFGIQPPRTAEGGGQRTLYRRRSEVWKVEAGGPSIIEAPGDNDYIPGLPTKTQEKAFADWFTELAYPWRASTESDSPPPKVVFRRTES